MKIVNPKGPNKGSYRVYRGGSWFNTADNLVVSFRLNLSLGYRYIFLGFRIACNGRKE